MGPEAIGHKPDWRLPSDQNTQSRDDQPLKQTVARSYRIVRAVRPAFRAKVLQRPKVLPHEFRQPRPLISQFQKLALPPAQLGPKEFRKLAKLPAILALADWVAWRCLCDATGISDLQERPQAIQGKAAVVEERLIHDFLVMFTAIFAVVIKPRIGYDSGHEAVSLSQALKHKNRLAGEIARLRAIVERENSRKDSQPARADVCSVFEESVERARELAALKGTIASANAGVTDAARGIYGKLNLEAELRGLIAFLKELIRAGESGPLAAAYPIGQEPLKCHYCHGPAMFNFAVGSQCDVGPSLRLYYQRIRQSTSR